MNKLAYCLVAFFVVITIYAGDDTHVAPTPPPDPARPTPPNWPTYYVPDLPSKGDGSGNGSEHGSGHQGGSDSHDGGDFHFHDSNIKDH